MDTALVVLMMAAWICGSFKNGANLPAPFQGNLAKAVVEKDYRNKNILPQYVRTYGNINAGKIKKHTVA